MFPHHFLSSDRQTEGPFPDPLRLPGARDCPGEQNPGRRSVDAPRSGSGSTRRRPRGEARRGGRLHPCGPAWPDSHSEALGVCVLGVHRAQLYCCPVTPRTDSRLLCPSKHSPGSIWQTLRRQDWFPGDTTIFLLDFLRCVLKFAFILLVFVSRGFIFSV